MIECLRLGAAEARRWMAVESLRRYNHPGGVNELQSCVKGVGGRVQRFLPRLAGLLVARRY